MSSPINKKTLEHLAALARIELDPKEEEKLLKDLGKILEHFTELQALDTANVQPTAPDLPDGNSGGRVTGGTDQKNIFRDDTERENTNLGAGVEAFPEHKEGFLKVPPVFE
ncbi:MAG: Asp-tRNA(Asn)/Glu-tRNA(Gln) amidotransferase subunit GatC [Patescibacteria group bacterium]